MTGKLQEIERIRVQVKPSLPSPDKPASGARFEVRDRIVERIRRIAGEDSITRVVPIQSQGDHKTQDIAFDMGDASYTVTVKYNNALTEGWVADLKKYPKKC